MAELEERARARSVAAMFSREASSRRRAGGKGATSLVEALLSGDISLGFAFRRPLLFFLFFLFLHTIAIACLKVEAPPLS